MTFLIISVFYFTLGLIILNVLTYKAKIQWDFLHLVMDVASVQDMFSHTLKSVHSSLFYCSNLLLHQLGKLRMWRKCMALSPLLRIYLNIAYTLLKKYNFVKHVQIISIHHILYTISYMHPKT